MVTTDERSYPELASQTKGRTEKEAKRAKHSTAANELDLRKGEHNMGMREKGRSHTKTARTVVAEGALNAMRFCNEWRIRPQSLRW
jgi:hypothetical protein